MRYIARMAVELWTVVEADSAEEAVSKAKAVPMDDWDGGCSDIDVEGQH